MIIRVTGKLAKRLKIDPMDTLPLGANPAADWTCRVFELYEGESLMLITNTASLYSFLAPANGLETKEQFGNGLVRYLERQMLSDNFSDVFRLHLKSEVYEMLLTKALNRSVTGSMTDMIALARHILIEGGNSLEETSVLLNRTPFKAIGYYHPREQFAALTRQSGSGS